MRRVSANTGVINGEEYVDVPKLSGPERVCKLVQLIFLSVLILPLCCCTSKLSNLWHEFYNGKSQMRVVYLDGPKLSRCERTWSLMKLLFLAVLIFPVCCTGRLLMYNLWVEFYTGRERTKNEEEASSSTCASLFSTFSLQSQIDELDRQVKFEQQNFEKENKVFKTMLKEFDDFIKRDQNLNEICLKYIQEYPEYIVPPTQIPQQLLISTNPIDQCTRAQMENNNLKHLKEERVRFFSRHHEAYEAFQAAMQKADVQQFWTTPPSLLIPLV